MQEQIVFIDKNEGRAGTVLIAEGFNRHHDQIKRLILKYKSEFEEISPLKGDIKKGRTKDFNEYLLDEDQFLFLGTLFRNNKQIVTFKLRLIKEFRRCRAELAKALNQRYNPTWQQARLTGKTIRLLETGEIQKFIEYAKHQGGTPSGCDFYYKNFTAMMNVLLFICEGKFKNLRDVLTPGQLMTIGSAEQVIGKSLRDGMAEKVFYKEIYKDTKQKVKLFAELHGQSEVLDKQMSLFD